MAVWKRFYGKKIKKGDENWDKGTWVAEGKVGGIRYKETLRRELVKTEKQAKSEDERIRLAFLSGEAVYLLDKTKLHDFIDETYLPFARHHNINYSNKVYECGQIKEFFPNLPLKQINVAWVRRFQNYLKTKQKTCQKCKHKIEHKCIPQYISPSSVNLITRTLSAVLRHAIDCSKLRENPVRKVEELKKPKPLNEFLTSEQKEKMFRELEPYPQLRNIVLVALLTGWRQGQILSLKASDLKENKTVDVIGSKGQEAENRPVSEVTWEVLSKLAKETPCDWLFYNPETMERIYKLPKQWNTVREKAGLGSFRFHSLRRTSATDMRALSVDLLTIQQVLGHQRLDTTQIYAQLKNEAVRKALNEVSEEYEKFLH